jgi:hypothetical protein
MAEYEVAISRIDFDFSTRVKAISAEEQADLVAHVLGRTWFLGVEADETLTGPLCQHISNATGCLVRDVKYTAKKVG